MTVFVILATLLLLIAANALYVAAEFGAVSVRPSRLKTLSEEGSLAAGRLLPHVEDPGALDRYIAACQIGITISSLVLGAYGESQLAPILAPILGDLGGWQEAAAHSLATIIILVTLTGAQMVLGELVPKGVALQYPDRTAISTAVPMSWSLRVFRPLIWLFNGSGLAVLRVLGVQHPEQRHVHNPGEIELLVTERTAGDDLEPEERRRLRRALHLSHRRAGELMSPRHRVVALEESEPIDVVMRKVLDARYSRFPVYRGGLDEPVGTLHAKDLATAHIQGNGELRDLLRPCMTVSTNATADQIVLAMRRKNLQQALVVDSAGRVAGLVTMTDVLGELFGALAEELGVGERPRQEVPGR